MTDSTTPNLPEEPLPQEVVAALKNRYGPASPIPESLNQKILTDAAGHLRTISSPKPASTRVKERRWRKSWVAMAAGSLAAALLMFAIWPSDGSHDAALMDVANHSPEGHDHPFGDEIPLKNSAASRPIASATEDIDQNGVINILDAFALARNVESSRPNFLRSNLIRWDLNGDGRADRTDIDLIAMQAVTL